MDKSIFFCLFFEPFPFELTINIEDTVLKLVPVKSEDRTVYVDVGDFDQGFQPQEDVQHGGSAEKIKN